MEFEFKNSTFFLVPEDIERLTGRRRYSAQIRWLSTHGYKFDVNGLGIPVVAIAEVSRKLVGGSSKGRATPKTEPNWDAM
jgi:hypothetical protein